MKYIDTKESCKKCRCRDMCENIMKLWDDKPTDMPPFELPPHVKEEFEKNGSRMCRIMIEDCEAACRRALQDVEMSLEIQSAARR